MASGIPMQGARTVLEYCRRYRAALVYAALRTLPEEAIRRPTCVCLRLKRSHLRNSEAIERDANSYRSSIIPHDR